MLVRINNNFIAFLLMNYIFVFYESLARVSGIIVALSGGVITCYYGSKMGEEDKKYIQPVPMMNNYVNSSSFENNASKY